MTTHKTAAQTRMLLQGLSLLGVAVLAAGVVLLISMLRTGLARPEADWVAVLGTSSPALLVAGVGLLIAVLPWIVSPVVELILKRSADEQTRYDQLMGAMENQRQLLEAVRDTSSLSDAAKQIAYRAKDREALRQAIREDIEKGDFEVAMLLVNDMERRFGYKEEAEQLREQVEAGWYAARDRLVRDTVAQIEAMLAKFDWLGAERQAQRLVRVYPEHPEVKRLPERITSVRDGHKRELLKQWKEAIARDDLDKSVQLLKELDQYLSPSEAEAYKESARDVFRKRLQQMGAQFALHAHDKNWPEAARIGKQIMEEFPNTRMAAEVREKMPILEEKAKQLTGVA